MNRIKAAMLFFPEHITKYQQYAEVTLTELFGDSQVDDAVRLQINTLQSGVLINNGTGSFDFRPLPSEAQMAPCLGLDLADVNDDGHLDIMMA
ncbi:VCBS repeat-containing protein, partial [bacterium LRH843]|nr:VCBS repeat-containing protein [bacterium LRH843]